MSVIKRYSIGIDEVGRGALAGPVLVGAIGVSHAYGESIQRLFPSVRDSKKMTARAREQVVSSLRSIALREHIFFTTARTGQGRIDKENISCAANDAAYRALFRVISSIRAFEKDAHVRFDIILDGGLFVKNKAYQREVLPRRGPCDLTAQTLVRADARFPIVSLASVLAKVTRDTYMDRLDKKYATYGFSKHKGYGTAAHRKALLEWGVSPAHRLTFCRKYSSI